MHRNIPAIGLFKARKKRSVKSLKKNWSLFFFFFGSQLVSIPIIKFFGAKNKSGNIINFNCEKTTAEVSVCQDHYWCHAISKGWCGKTKEKWTYIIFQSLDETIECVFVSWISHHSWLHLQQSSQVHIIHLLGRKMIKLLLDNQVQQVW